MGYLLFLTAGTLLTSSPVLHAAGPTFIEGWVTASSSGQALEGITVIAMTGDPEASPAEPLVTAATTTTDSSGAYSLDVSASVADQPIYVNVIDMLDVYGAVMLQPVIVTEGTTSTSSFSLGAGGFVHGHVLHHTTLGDIGVSESCVTVRNLDGSLAVPYEWPGTCSGQFNDPNYYAIPALPPGDYSLSFGTPDPSRFWPLLDQFVSVEAGVATVFNPSLPSAPPTALTGEVTESGTSAPLAGVDVVVSATDRFGNPTNRFGTTDAAGTFDINLDGMGSGVSQYLVSFFDPTGSHAAVIGSSISIQPGYTEAMAVELQPGGVVSGTISDAGGAPIEGACEIIETLSGTPVIPTDWAPCTGPDGTFRIQAVPAGQYRVRVFAPAGWLSTSSGTLTVTAGGVTDFGITLEPFPDTLITGVVLDEVTSAPIPGARISVTTTTRYGELAGWTAYADDQGEYSVDIDNDWYGPLFDWIDTSQPFTIDVFDDSGAHVAEFGATSLLQPGYAEAIEFDLAPGGNVAGVVTGGGTLPLQGACVILEDLGGNPIVPTDWAPCSDPTGRYATAGVPPGNYQARVFAPEGWLSQTVPVSVTVGQTTQLAVHLLAFPPTAITGTVVEDGTGAPLSGVQVHVSTTGFGGRQIWSTETDDDGVYEVDLHGFSSLAPYQVDFVDHSGTHISEFGAEVAVQVGYTEAISASLAPSGSISGVVRDSSGSPLAGACVVIEDLDGNPVYSTDWAPCTLGDGAYTSLGVPDGSYQVRVVAPPRFHSGTTGPVVISGGSPAAFDLTLQPVVTRITGVITDDSTGAPLAGLVVRTRVNPTTSPAIYATDTTDSAGSFTLDVSDTPLVDNGGTFNLDVADPTGQYVPKSGIAVTPQRGYDEPIGLSLELAGAITGTIRSSGGSAIPGACVSVRPAAAAASAASTCTGADGMYTFMSLAPGAYVLDVTPPNTLFAANLGTATTVVGGQSTAVDIVLASRPPATVTGHVTDEFGAPLHNAVVKLLLPGTSEVVAQSLSEPDGFYTVIVAEGQYDVFVVGPAGSALGAYLPNRSLLGAATLDIALSGFGNSVVVAGVVSVPAGWNGSVRVQCGTAQGTSIVQPDGSYLVSFEAVNPTTCSWEQTGNNYSAGMQFFNLSRTINVTTGIPTIINGPTYTPFPISVVNGDGSPAATTRLQINQYEYPYTPGSPGVQFPDGTIGSLNLNYETYNTSTTIVPLFATRTLQVSATLANGITINNSNNTNITGLTELVIVAPASATVVVSGVVSVPAGWNGSVRVQCGTAQGTSIVQPDGSYLVSFEAVNPTTCSWEQTGNNYSAGMQFFNLSRTINVTTGIPTIINGPTYTPFPISVVNGDGSPAATTRLQINQYEYPYTPGSPGVQFPDGTIGSLNLNYETYNTSTTIVPLFATRTLQVSATLANGITINNSNNTNITGLTELVIVAPASATVVVSGVVSVPAGWNGSVRVQCGTAQGTSIVQPDGSYLVSFEAVNPTTCSWEQTGNNYSAGMQFFNLSRTINVTTGIPTIINGPTYTPFPISVVNGDGSPAATTRLQINQYEYPYTPGSPGVQFPDGTIGSLNLNYETYNTSTTIVPLFATRTLQVSATLANGITINNSNNTNITGLTGLSLWLIGAGEWRDYAFGQSSDADGVDDLVEAFAPNGGDGNRDNIPDYHQANVSSLPSSEGNYVTFSAPVGTTFGNVRSIDPATLAVQPDPGYSLPEGLTDFRLDDIALIVDEFDVPVPQDVLISIYAADLTGVIGYAKFQDEAWTYLPTGRVVITRDGGVGPGGHVTIRLTDGGIGDDDGVVNGQIVDPGGLVRFQNSPPQVVLGTQGAVAEGSPQAVALTITDPNGDAVSHTFELGAPNGDAGMQCIVGGTETAPTVLCDDDGQVDLTVHAIDFRGDTASATVTLTFSNVAPAVSFVVPSSVGSATAAVAAVSTTDAGSNDTVSCVVDWGDGTTSGGCSTATHIYSPTSTTTYHPSITATDDDGASTTSSATITVIAAPLYHFGGFLQPVDPVPTVNAVKAGSAVPVKFSLGGDFGLNVLTPGYPTTVRHACNSAVVDSIESTVSTNGPVLTYNSTSGLYQLTWKTDKAWTGECRTLIIKFQDGSVATAEFKFK